MYGGEIAKVTIILNVILQKPITTLAVLDLLPTFTHNQAYHGNRKSPITIEAFIFYDIYFSKIK